MPLRPHLALVLVVLAAGCARPPDPVPAVAASADLPAPTAEAPAPSSTAVPAAKVHDVPAVTEASVSRDGKRRLFSRPWSLLDTERPRLEFFLVDGAGREDVVVREDPEKSLDPEGDLRLGRLYDVGFDPGGGRVLFSVENGRGEAIGAVDLRTRQMTWITSAFGFEHVVVPSGPHQGHLLVYKHLYRPEGGSYDQCWLVHGWTGRKLRDMTRVDSECLASPEMKRALGF